MATKSKTYEEISSEWSNCSSFKSGDVALPFSPGTRAKLVEKADMSRFGNVEGKETQILAISTEAHSDGVVLVDREGWVIVSFEQLDAEPLNFRNGDRYDPFLDQIEEIYGPKVILTGPNASYKPEWMIEKEKALGISRFAALRIDRSGYLMKTALRTGMVDRVIDSGKSVTEWMEDERSKGIHELTDEECQRIYGGRYEVDRPVISSFTEDDFEPFEKRRGMSPFRKPHCEPGESEPAMVVVYCAIALALALAVGTICFLFAVS
ncbi:MAG: hypothetical protein CMQ40_10825 [Gammaproteobacteria bacterium]|nr:hypothetical protein [Gammaproteobacteria bacterium]